MQTWAGWEIGRSAPADAQTIKRVAQIVHSDPAWLLGLTGGGDEEPPATQGQAEIEVLQASLLSTSNRLVRAIIDSHPDVLGPGGEIHFLVAITPDGIELMRAHKEDGEWVTGDQVWCSPLRA